MSSKVISNFVKSLTQQQQMAQTTATNFINARNFHTDVSKFASRHGGSKSPRMYYNILKERPLGPHKKLAPNVKYDGRMGEMENYRYVVHFPEVRTKIFIEIWHKNRHSYFLTYMRYM